MGDPDRYPTLRPVDARASHDHPGAQEVFDPSGIASSVITISPATAFIVARMDGRHTRVDVQVEYLRRFGRMLYSDDLDSLIDQLDNAGFLEGPRFQAHLAELTRRYRQRVRRPCMNGHVPRHGFKTLADYFGHMLLEGNANPAVETIRGLIAPHLDYERGAPCYAAAYSALSARSNASRIVVLGTNHYGRATAVVGTRKDFDTPLGPVSVDHELMQRLDDRTGVDLFEHEFDHVREHSVELQVSLLRHVLADRPFTIAPYLCPDPCGPTGTAPRDGRGADLRTFAEALRAEVEGDESILVVAGADLSHVGRYFHDSRELDEATLSAVEQSDRAALAHIVDGNAEGFRSSVAATCNDTNICSVGCIYAATMALRGVSSPRLVCYHQAVTREAENCVTCAAIEFTSRTREPDES